MDIFDVNTYEHLRLQLYSEAYVMFFPSDFSSNILKMKIEKFTMNDLCMKSRVIYLNHLLDPLYESRYVWNPIM
jgi:hypothetical protein